MKRRGQIDVAVVGGGVVGAACALVLAREGLEVMLVEGREPPRWSPSQPDLRVYAFAPDNAALLYAAGVWDAVRDARAQPYRRMRVWDAAGGDELRFDADALGRTQLGWIVENALLVDRLWAALPAAGVQVRCPARVEAMEQDADGVTLRLDDGTRIDARLAVAADGGDSTLRRLAGLEVAAHDYAQRGVVAFVRTGEPHGQAEHLQIGKRLGWRREGGDAGVVQLQAKPGEEAPALPRWRSAPWCGVLACRVGRDLPTGSWCRRPAARRAGLVSGCPAPRWS